jgi:hypothetical protein
MPRKVRTPRLINSFSPFQGQPIEADWVMARIFDYRFEILGVNWASTRKIQLRYEWVPPGSSAPFGAHSSSWMWDIRFPWLYETQEYKITFERESAPLHPLVAEQGTILNFYYFGQDTLPPNEGLFFIGVSLIGIGVCIAIIGGAYKSATLAHVPDYPSRGRL